MNTNVEVSYLNGSCEATPDRSLAAQGQIDERRLEESTVALSSIIGLRVSERRDVELLPVDIYELEQISLGVLSPESARQQGLAVQEVQARRKKINKFFDAKTRHQMVVIGIQEGYIPIALNPESHRRLTPSQETVLRLAGLGWDPHQIAERFNATTVSVDDYYEQIRKRLKSRNTTHSMRRAFELNIFEVGKDIEHPDEMIRINGIMMIAGNKSYRPFDLGIVFPRELEILALLRLLKHDSFILNDLYKLGFYRDASTENAREKACIKGLTAMMTKLEQGFGAPVIARVDPQVRRYGFIQPFGLEHNGEKVVLPVFDPATSVITSHPRGRGKTSGNKPPAKGQPTAQQIELSITESDSVEYLDRATLPELTPDFLAKLSARPSNEVLENNEVKVALSAILNHDLIIDYLTRVTVALRSGIPATNHYQAQMINRDGKYVRLLDIAPYVRPFQGLTAEATAQLTGITPLSILKIERKFIEDFRTKYKSLEQLIPYLEDEIVKLS